MSEWTMLSMPRKNSPRITINPTSGNVSFTSGTMSLVSNENRNVRVYIKNGKNNKLSHIGFEFVKESNETTCRLRYTIKNSQSCLIVAKHLIECINNSYPELANGNSVCFTPSKDKEKENFIIIDMADAKIQPARKAKEKS